MPNRQGVYFIDERLTWRRHARLVILLVLLVGAAAWFLRAALRIDQRWAGSAALAQADVDVPPGSNPVFLPLIANQVGQTTRQGDAAPPEKAFALQLQTLTALLTTFDQQLADGVDPTAVRLALQQEKSALLALDPPIRQMFGVREQNLRTAGLPALILERHATTVAAYNQQWQTLLEHFAALETAPDNNQLRAAVTRTQTLLQKSQPQAANRLPTNDDLAAQKAKAAIPVLTFETTLPTVTAAATQTGLSIPGTLPGATDLLPTIDVTLDQTIIDLAASLDNSPLQIYHYVKNNIAYEPYLGSRKGALATLQLQAGNDYDQASLLIALLRAAGIPARYVAGRALLPAAQVNNWLGVDSVNAAGGLLGMAGLAVQGYILPTGQALAFDHVWVAAYLPYTNYRGVAQDDSGKQWIALDPSVKALEIRPGLDIPAAMNFNATAFVDNYISTFHTASPVELYLQQIEQYVSTNYPTLTYPADIIRQRKIRPDPLPHLPASLPYLITNQSADFAEIPANKRFHIGFELVDGNYPTIVSFTYIADLPTLVGKRITLSYLPATPADQAVVDFYGNLYATPPNLIQLKPVLKVAGVPVAEGSRIAAGEYYISNFYYYPPAGDIVSGGTASHQVATGQYEAIAFDPYRMRLGSLLPPAATPDTDGLLGEELYRTAVAYLDRQAQSWELVADTMQVAYTTSVAQAIVTNLPVFYFTLDGTPVYWEVNSLTMDAQHKSVGGAFSAANGNSELFPFMLLVGADGSILENRVFEDLYDQEAVSAVKVLALAADAGIPICVITHGDFGNCDGLNQFFNFEVMVYRATALGYEVVVPRDTLTYHDWEGGGFIARDPVTKQAYWYMVEGGLKGGATVDHLVEWVNDWRWVFLTILGDLCTDEPVVTAEIVSPEADSYWPRQKDWLLNAFGLDPWNLRGLQPVFEVDYTICFDINGTKTYPEGRHRYVPPYAYPVGERRFNAGYGTNVTRDFTIFDVIVKTPEGVYAPSNGEDLPLEAQVIPEMPPDGNLTWEKSGPGGGNYSNQITETIRFSGTTTGNAIVKAIVTNPNGAVSDEQDLTVFGVKMLAGSEAFMGKGYDANPPDFPDPMPADPTQIPYYIDASNHPDQGLFFAHEVTMTVSSGNVLTYTTPLSMSLPGNRNTTWSGLNLNNHFVPAGVYQARIAVEAPNGKTTVSDPYDITVVEVTNVAFFDMSGNPIACPLPPVAPTPACNQHPTHGGGVRVFPDSLAAGQPRNNKVRVRATLGIAVPITAALPIYFQSYDVDDPTGLIDDNNTDLTVDIPVTGRIDDGISDGDNTVEVDFIVTMHPGDNFKVFASTNQSLLQNLSDAYVENAIDPTGATIIPLMQPLSSDRLTVWRYVHVERDSMTAVANALPGEENRVQGDIITIDQAAQQAHVDIVLRDGSDDLDSAIPRNGRFENGTLTIGVAAFPILGNGIDYLHYNNLQIPYSMLDSTGGNNVNGDILNMAPNGGHTDLTVTGPLVPNLYAGGTITIDGTGYGVAQNLTDTVSVTGSVQISFTLVDDDATADPSAPDVSHVIAGADNRFAYAYVEAQIHDNNADVPFVRNTGVTKAELIAGYDFDMKPVVENGDYWIVYLLGGFQFVELEDSDPTNEFIAWGYADDIGLGDGATIAMESYRDSPPNAIPGYGEPSTVAHEIGHLFGGGHNENGIMCSFGNHGGICNKTLFFGDDTLVRIRTIEHP